VRIGLAAHPLKPSALALALRARERIADRAEVVWSTETANALGHPGPSSPLETLDADVVLAFGGDGNFLYALGRTQLPLLPVHAGTVGFLAEVDGEDPAALDAALDAVLQGRFHVEDRMKLAAESGDLALPDATNEIVIHSSQVAKMRDFEIALDGEVAGRIRGDGVILATPTGSTSYALSALGPIVEPGVEAILVAALAPFQITQRAVLVDPLRTVSVRLVTEEKEAVVVVDGQSEFHVPGGSTVRAYRSPRRARFVRFGSSFFRRLRGKGILPWREERAGGREHPVFPPDA
jgi:NAD+ kinase